MIAILLDHTELYYTGINIIDYNVYVVNALVIFYVLSGYLMYKKEGINIFQKFKSIAYHLLLPYLIFSIVLAVPKAWAHGNSVDIKNQLLQIITGQSSWFVASLCLSELIFTLTMWITRGKNICLFTTGIIGFCISIYLSTGNQPYLWQLDNSLQALLFLCLGYFYHKYEQVFNTINHTSYLSFLFILLVIIKIYEYMNGVNMLIWYIHINNYPVFLIDILICSLFMIHFCKLLPPCKWIEWTGAHSLVYYFLCGGVPLLTTKFFEKINFNYVGNYQHVIVAFIIVYLITTLIVWLVYKYLPFTVGRKYETRK